MTIAIVRKKPSNNITMEGSASSINSRSAAIRNILLAAWRGKLSNEEWELRIRKVLPRGVNADVYDLADCLLKQALIGPVPNQLFMSYIKHAVQCELVSHSAVLSSIANQQINLRSATLLYRTSPVVCLLDFLKTFRHQLSCRGTEVECLSLCHSISELIHWLLKCMSLTVDYIGSQQQQPQQQLQLQQQQQHPQQQQQPQPNTGACSLSNPSGFSNSSAGGAINNHQGGAVGGTSNSVNTIPSSQIETAVGIIDLCAETIFYFINKPFTKSLLFITKIESPREFEDKISNVAPVIRAKLSACIHVQYVKVKTQHLNTLRQLEMTFTNREMHPSMVAAQQLRCLQTHRIRSTQITSSSNFERRMQQYNSSIATHDSSTNYALFNSLYPLVAFDAILRPARLNKHLARQIVTITNFNSAPVNMTYCELIRVCLIGLIDAHGNSKAKASWSFFTFLKLPRLLIELNKVFRKLPGQTATTTSPIEPNPATSFTNDLKLAFERLCEYSPLLDEAEFKCNCDLFKCLIKELIKNDSALAQLKNLDCRKFPARRPMNLTNNSNPMGGHMMLKTEPVVTSMLDTLNSEQDPADLFGILAQSCYGISFEYTLSAAAATGRLHLFVRRLIEHNELYKLPTQVNSANSRHVQAQALNFDITFLILTYIAQRYGPDLIEKNHVTGNATFSKWYHERYNHEASFKCPKEMLKDCNDEIVSQLIRQMLNRKSDIEMKQVNWHNVCTNLPKAVSEIVGAWTMGALSDDDINIVIDRLRSRMCFMAVVAASWLQCYIKTLDEEEKTKPLYFLNCLTKTAVKGQQQASHDVNSELKNDGFKERSGLLSAITKRIYFELVPNTPTTRTGSSFNGTTQVDQLETCQEPAAYHSYRDRFMSTMSTQEIFQANIKQCLARGWIDYDSLNSLSSLFKIIGSRCFTNLIVEQILTSHESPSDLSRAVNITFGLFHLDTEACAFALLDDVIPNWLNSEKKQMLLNQPRAFALANLAVMTIIEVHDNLTFLSVEDLPSPSSITGCIMTNNRPLNGIIKQEPGVIGNSLGNQMLIDSVDNASSIGFNGLRDTKRMKLSHDLTVLPPVGDNREPHSRASKDNVERLGKLKRSIAHLVHLFKEIMSDPMMDHKTLFPVLFLQQTVICAREKSDIITVHLQPDIVLDIIDLFSSELTFELVLAMSNMSSKNGRMYTAKAMCKLADIKESKQKTMPFPFIGPPHQQSASGTTPTTSSNAISEPNSLQQSAIHAGKILKSSRAGGESTPMMIG